MEGVDVVGREGRKKGVRELLTKAWTSAALKQLKKNNAREEHSNRDDRENRKRQNEKGGETNVRQVQETEGQCLR